MSAPVISERIAYRDGYRYQLAESYAVDVRLIPATLIDTPWIRLDRDGVLTIHEGYAWDGASGATIDSPCAMRPSLVHDALYQLIGLGLLPRETREHADRIFRELCAEDGMGVVRRTLWHHMVRRFGPADGSPMKPVRYAPAQE